MDRSPPVYTQAGIEPVAAGCMGRCNHLSRPARAKGSFFFTSKPPQDGAGAGLDEKAHSTP